VIDAYLHLVVLALLTVGAPLFAWLELRSYMRKVRQETHERLAAGLTDGVVTDTPLGLVTEGRRGGRRLRLTFGPSAITYEVEVPGWESALSLDAKQARAWVGAGAHVDEARGAVAHLFGVGVQRLEAQDGWLRVSRAGSNYASRLKSVEAVFAALERLAPLFTRAPLTIRVAEVEVKVHAWQVGQQASCPFCRDALGSVPDDLAACDACHTAHHRECLTEAGGCTVFGCSGGAPRDRARVAS
jgi:hypothetical protein